MQTKPAKKFNNEGPLEMTVNNWVCRELQIKLTHDYVLIKG